jgi:hypothetical protein
MDRERNEASIITKASRIKSALITGWTYDNGSFGFLLTTPLRSDYKQKHEFRY